MKRRAIFGIVMAMLFVIPVVVNAQKPKLAGTSWQCDETVFMADVGTVGNSEDILFLDKTNLTFRHVKWVQMVLEDSPREFVDEATGEVRVIKGRRHRTSRPEEAVMKGTYTMNKQNLDGNKVYCVHIELEDGPKMDLKVEGDSLISLSEDGNDPREYKKM